MDLRWRTPDGEQHEGAAAILVSNNRYRLREAPGQGTRPRLDEGLLGVAVLGMPADEPAARSWATQSFEVDARAPVPAGVDGEPQIFDPPLRFRLRPAALRCRISRHHPGASPSAFLPEGAWAMIRTLAGIAVGRDPRPLPADSTHARVVASRTTSVATRG